MGLSIKPIACHGGCLGCYEKNIRESAVVPNWGIEKVIESLKTQMALDKENKWNCPTLHGGEPLMLPLNDIEAILKTVFEKYGQSSIQTSGAFLLREHIDLFIQYKTSVGISVDGDRAATNWGRWNNQKFDAAEMTEKTLAAMREIKTAGLCLSTISLLRKCNAGTPALRADLARFGLRLHDEFGVGSSRFNAMIAFDDRAARDEELEPDDLAAAYQVLAVKVHVDENLKWYPILDFAKGLRNEPTECVFGECDPWATEAEIPILGDGSLSVCMKRDGLIVRTGKSRARYEALVQIPQKAGGCLGCFWWRYCTGGCPGAGIGGDWRNRTRFCQAYKKTFEFMTSLAIFPVVEPGKPAGSGGHGDREHGDSNDPAWRAKNPWWKGKVEK